MSYEDHDWQLCCEFCNEAFCLRCYVSSFDMDDADQPCKDDDDG
jgi:hypothetical protein